MSDSRMRALERRWRETRSLADEVEYLSERLRGGLLSVDRLRLAAHCGSEAARRVLCITDPLVLPDHASSLTLDAEPWRSWVDAFGEEPWYINWAHEVAPHGREIVVRMGVAVARALLPRLAGTSLHASADASMHLLGSWIDCPCDRHQMSILEAASTFCPDWDVVVHGMFGDLPRQPMTVFIAVLHSLRVPPEVAAFGIAAAAGLDLVWARGAAEVVPWILRADSST